MSSTSEKQLPDAEIEALTAAVQVVTSKEKLLAKHVFNALLKLLNTSADISAGELVAELLRAWLSRVQSAESLVKVFLPVLLIPASFLRD